MPHPHTHFASIRQAEGVLDGRIKRTPLVLSKTFSEMANASVWLKLENFQLTGSFKVRGALYKINRLTPAERAAGVVCASAGNHAQGVAYAATALGIPSRVFMPQFAPPAKVQATEGYGAAVELVGTYFDEAYAAAQAYAQKHGQTFIPAFDDDYIIAGQGTIGLELLQDLAQTDVVLCPVGGGGLIGGVGVALKTLKPSLRLIGVEAEGAPALQLSLQQGRLVSATHMDTIADGIAVKTPGMRTFDLALQYVDEVVTVPDGQTALAIYLLLQRAKIVVEPAGAVGLAALLAGKIDCQGQHVAVIISGGNLDPALMTQIIERGLLRDKLRARIAVDVPDRPGSLNALLSLLTAHRINVQDIAHDRHMADIPIGHVRVTITFRTLGESQTEQLRTALQEAGMKYVFLP